MKTVRNREHGNCVVCSRSNGVGLGVVFAVSGEGAVEARFGCEKEYEGYNDVIHGGVISSLIDGAMTNCVFAKGYVAFTAELTIRFHRPVAVGSPALVRARIEKTFRPLHYLKAELLQDGVVKVTAEAKFMERPDD
jgi:uncharacterized protein (TIGR00369 family)